MSSTTIQPCTTLCKASFDGDLGAVTRLLQSNVDYLESDNEGKTALHWAVAQHRLEVVQTLLDHHHYRQQMHPMKPTRIHTLTYHEIKHLASRTRPMITAIELAALVDDEAIFKILLEHLESFSDSTPVFNRIWPPLATSKTRWTGRTGNAFGGKPFEENQLPQSRGQAHGGQEKRMDTVLRLAIKDDKFAMADMLLRLGADANAIHHGSDQSTLAIAAAYRPNPDYIRLLLQYGANPVSQVPDALHLAIECFNEEAFLALLDSKEWNNQPSSWGTSPLRLACSLAAIESPLERDVSFPLRAFRSLLDAGAIVDTPTLIDILQTNAPLPFLKELSTRGVDITVAAESVTLALSSLSNEVEPGTPKEHQDALDIFAVAYDSLPRLRDALLSTGDSFVPYDLLLHYGLYADGPMREEELLSLVDVLVARRPNPGYLEAFMESDHDFPYDRNQLMHRVDWKLGTSKITPEGLDDTFLGVVRLLDQCGETHPGVVTRRLFEIVKSYRGDPRFGIEAVIELLLDLGAGMRSYDESLELVDESTWEAYDEGFFDIIALSAIYGQERILSFLLQKLPWPEASLFQHSPWPSWFRQEEFDSLRPTYNNDVDTTMACLASSKFLFTPRLADSECPLLVAVDRGDLHAVQTLISLGVDVNMKARYGWTALHAAAQEGHEAIVDALILANASVDAQTLRRLPNSRYLRPCLESVGGTPLHAAAVMGNLHVIKKLLHHGADVHVTRGGKRVIAGEPQYRPFIGRTALDLVLLSGHETDREDKREPWLHPDRLTAGLLLLERGAILSEMVARKWKVLKLDDVLEKFAAHPSLWDAFVAGDWDHVEEGEVDDDSGGLGFGVDWDCWED